MDEPDVTPARPPTLPSVDDEYLALGDVADALGISPDDVKQVIRSGALAGAWIPEHRTWHVRRSDLDAYRQQ